MLIVIGLIIWAVIIYKIYHSRVSRRDNNTPADYAALEKARRQKKFLETRLLSLNEQYAILLAMNRKISHDIECMDEKELKRLLSIERQIASIEKQKEVIYNKMTDINKYL